MTNKGKEQEDELITIKIYRSTHRFLKYVPALGIPMQDYASQSLLLRFQKDYPELYNDVLNKLEEQERHCIEHQLADLDS